MTRDPQTATPDGRGTPHVSTVMTLLGTLADTTWRVFAPIIVLGGIGLWIDLHYHTKPWLLLTGTVVGMVVAALLVAQQYKQVTHSEPNNDA